MRIACVMMCKDETDLIAPWCAYHGGLFGYDNLHILDNGSSDLGYLEKLEQFETKGVHVDRRWREPGDYTRQGELQAACIRELDLTQPADFYFPLDCDEFVGAETASGTAAFDGATICKTLEPFRNDAGALMIGAGFWNCLQVAGMFQRRAQVRKTFFARQACVTLDNGSHQGLARDAGRRTSTAIVYAHFHFKPHKLYIKHAMQKLAPYLGDLSAPSLEDYRARRLPNYHVIDKILEDEIRYNARIDPDTCVDLPELRVAFQRLGIELPFQP